MALVRGPNSRFDLWHDCVASFIWSGQMRGRLGCHDSRISLVVVPSEHCRQHRHLYLVPPLHYLPIAESEDSETMSAE